MKSKTINLLSINSFSTIPVLRYIIEDLSTIYSISILHCQIVNQPLNIKVNCKEKYIGRFQDGSDFNKQTTLFKIIKYLKTYSQIIFICLKRGQIIFSIDYQIVSFILKNNYLLKIFNTKLIYFQFELVDPLLINFQDRKKIKIIKNYNNYLDLAIFPEINRLKYFCSLSNYKTEKTFIFPNTCKVPSKEHALPPIKLRTLPSGAIVFGHIGNIGPDHYLQDFLNAVDSFVFPNVFFIMVGRTSSTVKKMFDSVKNPNFILIGEVPHSELHNIYPFLSYGLILYKGVDKNFEYCAPNKLYEYWSYGIPVIAHNLPGLVNVINRSFLGRLIDFENNELISLLPYLVHQPLPDKKFIQDYFQKDLSITHYLGQLQTLLKAI